MAKITEQAIAEVRIDDTQAADRLQNLADRARELREQLSQTNDKKAFDALNRDLKLVEKEMNQVFAQTVNVKKILSDLNGTSFNKLVQAQRQLNAQFKAGKISAQEYAAQIGPINARIQELQQTMRTGVSEQESGWKSLLGAAGKFVAGLGIAKLALDGFNRVMNATNDLNDEYEVKVARGKAATESFFRTIATGDWSNMLTNMRTAAKAAEDYTRAMDLIGDRLRSINLITKENKKNADMAALDAADQTKSNEERAAALEKSLDLLKQNLEITKQIREEVAETEVERVSKEFGIQKEHIRDIITNYNEYSRVQEGADRSRLEYAKEILNAQKELERINNFLAAQERMAASTRNIAYEDNKALKIQYEQFMQTVSGSDMIFAQAFGAYEHITDEALQHIEDSIGNVIEAESEYATAARRRTSQLSGFQKQESEAKTKAITDALEKEMKALEKNYEKRQLVITKELENQEITEGVYKMKMVDAEIQFLQDKINLQKKYGQDSVKTEIDRSQKIIEEAKKNADILKKLMSGNDAGIDTAKLMADSDKLFEKAFADMTKELNAQADYVEKQLDDEFAAFAEKYQEWMQIRQEYGLVGLDEQYRVEKAKLDELHAAGIMEEELYQQALLAMKLRYAEEYANKAAQFTQGLQNVVTGLEDLALQKSNIRKEKELAAAGDNADARAAIEEKYAKEELDIQKKYADANFALQVTQIIASTALAAMQAYSALAGIVPVGPVLGAIAAAAAVAAGAVQIAKAKAARDQAKSVSMSGSGGGGSKITSAGGYHDGGPTGPGNPHEPAGIVHRGEYVVPNVVMRNPAAIDHVRVLEAMRQSYYPGRRRSPGFLEGGSTAADPMSPSSTSETANQEAAIINTRLLEVLEVLTPAVERLNQEGAKVSYERIKDSETSANKVIYRATRK